MKKIILTILIFIFCLNSLFAQTKDEPTPAEKRQAQRLAARFYNRFAQTQDITPLIKEFFVSDFSKRWELTLLESSDDDVQIFKKATSKDILRFYTALLTIFIFI